jgi:hypothetical protein
MSTPIVIHGPNLTWLPGGGVINGAVSPAVAGALMKVGVTPAATTGGPAAPPMSTTKKVGIAAGAVGVALVGYELLKRLV